MNLAEELTRLKPKTRRALEKILATIQKTGDTSVIESLRAVDYEREIVPPRQFVEDDYFLGKNVKNLSEAWKQELEIVFDPDSTIGTIIITGAIGIGKTTFAAICLTRKLYELSCLRDPSHFFGLLPKSKIIFGVYNITLDKADDVSVLVEQYVNDSPYFQEKCAIRPRPHYPLYFPEKRLEVASGSLASHALGDNVLGFILDEANFHKKVQNPDAQTEKTRAHQLFNEARSRQVSRFLRRGRLPGLTMLLSSRKFQSSMLDELIEKVAVDPDLQQTVRIIQFALWEIKNPDDFSGEHFDVVIGTEHYASRVLEFEEIPPEGSEIVSVPVEYREQFFTDADLALRDIAGISTAGSTAFFPVKQKILNCIENDRTHPFSRPVLTLALGSDTRIDDFFQERKLCKIERSVWCPLVHPEAPRHLHIDLAYSEENVGIAMGHPYIMRDAKFGVYVDFMLRISPPVKGQIPFAEIIAFVNQLRNTYRFRIKKVTFDQYQSRMPIQLLLQAGFEAELLSIDLIHYTHLKTCFTERRINMYEYAPLLEEVDGLRKNPEGGRPNHKPGSFDDILDALAGAVSRCYNISSSRARVGTVKKDKVVLPRVDDGPIVMSVNESHRQEEFRPKP
jgi:hypothetical protein